MMKKLFMTAAMLFCILPLSAQKINNAEDLKKFYTEYCTYIDNISGRNKLDSLLTTSCTKELVKEWHELVDSIGLYDLLRMESVMTWICLRRLLPSARKETIMLYHSNT
mgnify:CR=1 FL=1